MPKATKTKKGTKITKTIMLPVNFKLSSFILRYYDVLKQELKKVAELKDLQSSETTTFGKDNLIKIVDEIFE